MTVMTDGWMVRANLSDSSYDTGEIVIGHAVSLNGFLGSYNIGTIRLQECPADSNDSTSNWLVIAFAQASRPDNVVIHSPLEEGPYPIFSTATIPLVFPNLNYSVLYCKPSYKLDEALVTTDALNSILDVVPKGIPKTPARSGWDMVIAFKNSLTRLAQVLLDSKSNKLHTNNWLQPPYDAFFSILTAVSPQEPDERYLDGQTLETDSRRLYSATCAQIANRYLRQEPPSSDAISGSYKATELHLILRDLPLRLLENGIAIVAFCTLLMLFLRPTVPNIVQFLIPGYLVTILASSSALTTSLHHSGNRPTKILEQITSGCSFALASPIENEPPILQIERFQSRSGSVPTQSDSKTQWWKPFALSKPMRAIVLALPLAAIISMETTYQMSARCHGLGDVPVTGLLHYTWTIISALVMTAIKLLHSQLHLLYCYWIPLQS